MSKAGILAGTKWRNRVNGWRAVVVGVSAGRVTFRYTRQHTTRDFWLGHDEFLKRFEAVAEGGRG